MSFVVDTDTCSAYIKAHPLVWNRFMQYAGRLYLSVVTLAELTIWVSRKNAPPKRAHDVVSLLNSVTPLDATVDVARKFGQIQAGLMDAGKQVPEMDLFIGATALVHGYTVVTHNTQDYAMIPGLTIVDWMVP
jgi:tRNA(fMet)-specific endonuclease VapC